MLYTSKWRSFMRRLIKSYEINVTHFMCGTQSAMINGYAFFLFLAKIFVGTSIDDRTDPALPNVKGKCTLG